MRKLLPILLLFAAVFCAGAQEPVFHTMNFQRLERGYYLYVPDSMDIHRPLVVMLHGYGGSAEGYRPEMVETARRHGFALCIPDGWPSPRDGRKGWNVRYPKQEGLETDDVAFIRKLVRKLQREYDLSPDATFLTGMSNGGEMCYVFAWKSPKTFRAIASVAGLTMTWLPEENRLPDSRVPFMEIHGTADRTSEWDGDPHGDGGWGPYMSVPLAVGNIAAMNKCTYCTESMLPLKDSEKPSRQVILHRYLGGEGSCETRLYEVVGGKHSWHLDDIDTTEEIWLFFRQYLKN